MTITIYHNPSCSKSRETLEIIRACDTEPKIINYIKDSLDVTEIKKLYAALKIDSAHSMLRTKEQDYTTAKLSSASSDQDIFRAIACFPKLLERPIVITPKGARICRPPEIVNEIL